MPHRLVFTLILVATSFPPPAARAQAPPAGGGPSEHPVTIIPLAGPMADSHAEVSSLAWYGDHLVFLPQFPEHHGGHVFALPRADVEAFVAGRHEGPLTPAAVPFSRGASTFPIAGTQGFEALAFAGDHAYLTIEARREGRMINFVVGGRMAPDLGGLTLDGSVAVVRPQTGLGNTGEEALVATDDGVVSIHEVHGAAVNGAPVAHVFGADLGPPRTLPFPPLEYRVTDATAVDGDGRFWVVNYFFPGDHAMAAATDPLAERFGRGATHARSRTVERLVALRLGPDGITLTDAPPVQLVLDAQARPRNWEGVVRLGDEGFLLITDRYPETIFAFVPR